MKLNTIVVAALGAFFGCQATAFCQQIVTLKFQQQEAVNNFSTRTGIIVSRAALKELSTKTMSSSDASIMGKLLERMPVLHITVQPEPPLDYSIKVNDDPAISPQRKSPNNIAIPPGRTTVRITRGEHASCVWGPRDVMKDETISCKLPD